MSPSRALAVTDSEWMCGDLEGGFTFGVWPWTSQPNHPLTQQGCFEKSLHNRTDWLGPRVLAFLGSCQTNQTLRVWGNLPFHRHHDYSQSSWSIILTLLGQVTFTNKPSSFQKLNQKRRGHREVTVRNLYHLILSKPRGGHSSTSLSVGEELPEGWGAVGGKKGTKPSHSNPSKGIL